MAATGEGTGLRKRQIADPSPLRLMSKAQNHLLGAIPKNVVDVAFGTAFAALFAAKPTNYP